MKTQHVTGAAGHVPMSPDNRLRIGLRPCPRRETLSQLLCYGVRLIVIPIALACASLAARAGQPDGQRAGGEGTLTALAGGHYVAAAGGPPAGLAGTSAGTTGEVDYTWDADISTDSNGDGNTSNDVDAVGACALWTYTQTGVYTARLTVVTAAGPAAADDAVVTVFTNLRPQVVCVAPYRDPSAQHPAISGQPVKLKGIARDAGSLTYQWDFGDGTPPDPLVPTAVINPAAIEASHTYTGHVGMAFAARLRVWDAEGLPGSDAYEVRLVPDELSVRSDIAIEEGLWWLHKDQNRATGAWASPYGSSTFSAAAAAVHAFEVTGHSPAGDPREDPFVETTRLGLRYLTSGLRSQAITSQPAGNPDSNGNGIGVAHTASSTFNLLYECGMVMSAIAASQSPLMVALSGPTDIKGRCFRDILTDMVDFHVFAQNDSGTGRGGWSYSINDPNRGDNSLSMWPVQGMVAAERNFGIPVPQFVRQENSIWLATSWDGQGFGYTGKGHLYATTAAGLIQATMDGYATTSALWQATEAFLGQNWPINGSTSKVYYADYAIAGALRLALPQPVFRLRGTGLDWLNDPLNGLRQKIVSQQQPNGSWSGYATPPTAIPLGGDLSTAWAVMILNPGRFAAPPLASIEAPRTWGFGTNLLFHADDSHHLDTRRRIVKYEWDFDNNGVFDVATTNPVDPTAVWSFPDPRPSVPGDAPQTNMVRLRVTDNSVPALVDEATLLVIINESPLPPSARLSIPAQVRPNESVVLDGAASCDPNPGDSITEYQWDLDADGRSDRSTTEPRTQVRYSRPGLRNLGLRVVDSGFANGGLQMTSDWEYAVCRVQTPPEYPSWTEVNELTGDTFSCTLVGVGDTSYIVETVSNLDVLSWHPIWTNRADATGLLEWTNHGSGSARQFYRARETQP